MDDKHAADLMCLDSAKAFDIIPHNKLLQKMQVQGRFRWVKTG